MALIWPPPLLLCCVSSTVVPRLQTPPRDSCCGRHPAAVCPPSGPAGPLTSSPFNLPLIASYTPCARSARLFRHLLSRSVDLLPRRSTCALPQTILRDHYDNAGRALRRARAFGSGVAAGGSAQRAVVTHAIGNPKICRVRPPPACGGVQQVWRGPSGGDRPPAPGARPPPRPGARSAADRALRTPIANRDQSAWLTQIECLPADPTEVANGEGAVRGLAKLGPPTNPTTPPSWGWAHRRPRPGHAGSRRRPTRQGESGGRGSKADVGGDDVAAVKRCVWPPSRDDTRGQKTDYM
jgi:hypothetical protein